MSNHKKMPDPAVIYQAVEMTPENECELEAAYEVVFQAVLGRSPGLSTSGNPN